MVDQKKKQQRHRNSDLNKKGEPWRWAGESVAKIFAFVENSWTMSDMVKYKGSEL